MRFALPMVIACGSSSRSMTEAPDPKPAVAPSAASQTVHEGLALLCASAWNGELRGPAIRRYLPDELRVITNDEVIKLMTVLVSPHVKRVELFDQFLAENHIEPSPCLFRERLSSWPAP